MTPKEKAYDIWQKMMNADILIDETSAKQCALIAVDEVWRQLESARVFEDYDYWQEVKQELKNYILTNNA